MFPEEKPLVKISPILLRLPRSRRIIAGVWLAILMILCIFPRADMRSQTAMPEYKNPRLPVEQRGADLLSRMTLEEKVAQLTCLWTGRPQVGPQGDFSTDRGDFSPDKARLVMKYGIGQVARPREQKGPLAGTPSGNPEQESLHQNTRHGPHAIVL